jgi:hypothetical protein
MPTKDYVKPAYEYFQMTTENGKVYDICRCNEEGFEGIYFCREEIK